MSEILSYEKFVENLRAYLLDALNLQEERIYFKVKDEAGMTPEGDRLFVECNVSPEGKEVCGIHTEELYEDCLLYTSYRSGKWWFREITNKNCQAGDIDLLEHGNAKTDVSLPIFNYSVACDSANREPLFYELYPGSINDISQLTCMIDKAHGYGYRNIGFILDRGCLLYTSKVDSYRCKNRLFIAMIKKKDQEEELYDILTVSLPGENIKINEAFISDFECKYKLSFIRKYKLGEVLQVLEW